MVTTAGAFSAAVIFSSWWVLHMLMLGVARLRACHEGKRWNPVAHLEAHEAGGDHGRGLFGGHDLLQLV